MGPVALNWAAPYLKSTLARNFTDLKIDFDDVVLTWHPATGDFQTSSGIEVRFVNISLTDRINELSVNIPEAYVEFSALGMLRGMLAPVRADFSKLHFEFPLPGDFWESGGEEPFQVKLQRLLDDFQTSQKIIPRMTRQLLSEPAPMNAAGYLKELTFRDSSFTFIDEASGSHWIIPGAVLNMKRTDEGLLALLEGDILFSEINIAPLHLSIAHNNRRKDAILQLRFSNLSPGTFAGDVKELEQLKSLNVPLNGIIDIAVGTELALDSVIFEVEAGAGTLNAMELYPAPVALDNIYLSGHYSGDQQIIFLDQFLLRIDKAEINGDGLLYGSLREPGVTLNARIGELLFSNLVTYWPPEKARGARKWISKNISAGSVRNGTIDVKIDPEMWKAEQLPETAFEFRFDIRDVAADYLHPMPLLKNVSGSGYLNLKTFTLTADQGDIDNVTVSNGELLFRDIDKKGGALASFKLPLSGSVEDILAVIDHKPLGYPSKYGIEPGSVTGKGTAILSLEFPLLKKLSLKQVEFQVDAQIDNLKIPHISDKLSIMDGNINLSVNGNSLRAEGDILLNGVKFAAVWNEAFETTGNELPTSYHIKGPMAGADWDAFNLPFRPYVEGPAVLDLELRGRGASMKTGTGHVDLLSTRITFDPIGWIKEENISAGADFKLDFKNGNIIEVRDINIVSSDFQASSEVLIVEDRTARLAISRLRMPDMDFDMEMVWNAEKQNYNTSIRAREFDARPILKILKNAGSGDEDSTMPDFDVSASLQKVKAENGVTLWDTTLQGAYTGGDFRSLDLKAFFEDGKEFTVNLGQGEKDRLLKVKSSNAGETLRGTGVFNVGVNGTMEIAADYGRRDGGLSIEGRMTAEDFLISDSPGVSKLLEEKDFSKAREELKKGGLQFDKFQMDFHQYNGILDIKKGTARGNALGVTMSGKVDQSYNEVNIEGTIVPAYGLNSLFSNIPIIGAILTGGKGQGIFAATFEMTGTMQETDIRVNPLAALAPGILRNIFSVLGGSDKKTLREEAEELQGISPDTPPPGPQD
ncbi:AsmA-like C-terminal domain-containing protein [Emcibacter sp.]|uniref:YhdP family protein n=1 Tax=Emcibacter sp. TaxID=1979954 RepID=UPI002AA6F8C0|nr:AsmA-like C-terminal domain-containing protein [Emcibacter sp.]